MLKIYSLLFISSYSPTKSNDEEMYSQHFPLLIIALFCEKKKKKKTRIENAVE